MNEVHFLLPAVARHPVGGYKVVYEYANALVAAGHEVHVWHSAAFLPAAPHRRLMQRLKALMHSVRHYRRRAGGGWFALDRRVHAHVTARLPKPHLAAEDLVVATAVETMYHAADLAMPRGVVSLGLIQHYEDWQVSDEYIRAAWGSVHHLMVIAPWLEAKAAQFGLSSTLLPNVIDARAFPPGESIAERPFQALSMLSHQHFKRPDLVMETLERVQQRQPDVRAITFGQMPRPRNLPATIEYVENPDHETLRRLYQTSRVYLCASDAEGWHLPPAEATLSGAAVVSTRIGGVTAYMEDDALYATTGDTEGLVDMIMEALANPTASQERAEHARRRITGRSMADNLSLIERSANQARESKHLAAEPRRTRAHGDR